MITVNGDQFIALLMGIAVIFFLIGGAIEYCQTGGVYDLTKDLARERKENERLREELHFTDAMLARSIHPAGRALNASVASQRPHLSLIKSEPGA